MTQEQALIYFVRFAPFTVAIAKTHLGIKNVHERLRRLERRGYRIDRAVLPDGKTKVYWNRGIV